MQHHTVSDLFLLLIFCIPFSFLAMYGDISLETMWFYGLFFAGLGFGCYLCMKRQKFLVMILGNILSALVSLAFLFRFETADWSWYFKPFSAMGMSLVLSFLALVLSVLVWFIRKHYLAERKDLS